MGQRIAFFTFGVMPEAVGHVAVQGFIDRIAGVYDQMDGSAGFVARSERDLDTWAHSWGPMLVPPCAPPGTTIDRTAMTLSLWRDMAAVAAFAYRGAHGEALSRRTDWFLRGPWPGYVAWWVGEDHRPDWVEGVDRFEHLHAHGPTARAFDFRQPFDSDGRAIKGRG